MWLRIEMDSFEQAVLVLRGQNRLSGHSILWTLLKRSRIEAGVIGGIALERGQCVIGYKELGTQTHTSTQTARTIIKGFERAGILTTKATPEGTKVTIRNYDDLAIDFKQNQHANQHQGNTPLTREQHASNTQVTTNTVGTKGTVVTQGTEEQSGSGFPCADILQKIQVHIGYTPPFLPSRDLKNWKRVIEIAQGNGQIVLEALNNYSALKACREANGAWPFVLKVLENSVTEQMEVTKTISDRSKKRKEKGQEWKKTLEPDYGKDPNNARRGIQWNQ